MAPQHALVCMCLLLRPAALKAAATTGSITPDLETPPGYVELERVSGVVPGAPRNLTASPLDLDQEVVMVSVKDARESVIIKVADEEGEIEAGRGFAWYLRGGRGGPNNKPYMSWMNRDGNNVWSNAGDQLPPYATYEFLDTSNSGWTTIWLKWDNATETLAFGPGPTAGCCEGAENVIENVPQNPLRWVAVESSAGPAMDFVFWRRVPGMCENHVCRGESMPKIPIPQNQCGADCTDDVCCTQVKKCREHACQQGGAVVLPDRECAAENCTDGECCSARGKGAVCAADNDCWSGACDNGTWTCTCGPVAGLCRDRFDCCGQDNDGNERTCYRETQDALGQCGTCNPGGSPLTNPCSHDWECCSGACGGWATCASYGQCDDHSCGRGWERKTPLPTEPCRFFECLNEECCDAVAPERLCSNHQCGSGWHGKYPTPGEPCAGAACADDECCDAVPVPTPETSVAVTQRCRDWHRCDKRCCDWHRCEQRCCDWHRCEQRCRDWHRCDQRCRDWHRCDKRCCDWHRCEQRCRDWHRCDQRCRDWHRVTGTAASSAAVTSANGSTVGGTDASTGDGDGSGSGDPAALDAQDGGGDDNTVIIVVAAVAGAAVFAGGVAGAMFYAKSSKVSLEQFAEQMDQMDDVDGPHSSDAAYAEQPKV
eukprot:TRINITY_DN2343_c0_g1_i7.p1 TRINITY_DN2343_c0_g1~~TRINITY_DN2343_c0_g1_i7.p1  ORF type:complete len:655 (+),score=-9.80 TRINITY_DN2343_c0_g1_i7:69-2033(+)